MADHSKQRRMCVVGLDGVPIGLLEHLAQGSVMPRAARVLQSGKLKRLRVPLPPVSSVSWSSFMTGANPGEHGIFGFTDVAQDSYRLRFPGFRDLAVPTFWDRLGEAGLRCVVLNQPATYPARAHPGVLLSGFVAPDLARSVWPLEHLATLEGMGYRTDIDAERARRNPAHLLDDLEATLAVHRRAALHFWERESWDCFEFVVTGTDRLHHFLWHSVTEQDNPWHARAMHYYQMVDELIGELWDRFHQGRSGDREGEGFLLLSDHGFTGVRWEVRINAWLREKGYLDYRTDSPQSVADIAPGTRAFALDPGRMYLNLKGRFADGCVDPGEADLLQAEIADGLRGMTREGEPAVAHVFTRAEAYHGPRSRLGPDLVAVGRDGFDLKGSTKQQEVFAGTHFQGMHTLENAFVWSLLPFPDDPEMADLAGAVVAWLTRHRRAAAERKG